MPKLIPLAISTTEATDFWPPKSSMQVPWSHAPPVIESVPAWVARFWVRSQHGEHGERRTVGEEKATHLEEGGRVAIWADSRVTVVIQVLRVSVIAVATSAFDSTTLPGE